MAKKPSTHSSNQPGQPARGPGPAGGRSWPHALAISIGVLVAFLAVAYFALPDELSAILQRGLGLVCAGLAVAVFAAATREREDELLHRLRRGQHLDFGKRLRSAKKQRRTVKLPFFGQASFRALGGVAVFLLVDIWWWTPLAPIGVSELTVEDLAIPLGNQIVAAVLLLPDGQAPVLQPPIVPRSSRQLAEGISEDAAAYDLGMKAIAQGRSDDARKLLEAALKGGKTDAVMVHVARAQAEMFACQFGEAVKWYDNALKLKPDEPALLGQAAVAQMHAESFQSAEPLVAKFVEICQASQGKDDSRLAASLHVRAVSFIGQGREFDQAEVLNKKVQDTWSKILGEAHPFVAASLNNQAVLYQIRAKYPGVPQLNNWAREIWSEKQGEQQPLVAGSLSNLAMLNCLLGNYQKATGLNERALTIRRETLPPTHPLLALSSTSIATVQLALGQCKEGITLCQAALTTLETELGPQHAAVAPTLNTLATLYTAEARYTRAEPYHLRAIATTRNSLGPEHPYLANCLNALASLYIIQGRFDEADALGVEALRIGEKTLGDDHPTVAASLLIRGMVQLKKGDPRAARPFWEKALRIQENTFGKEHPAVADTLGDLAALDNSPRTYTKGIARYKRAIEMDRRLLGDEHPAVARLLVGLAALYVDRNKYARAEPYLKEALAIREKALVDFHPVVADTMEAYAAVLRKVTPPNTDLASDLQSRAQAIRAKHTEEDRPE